MSKRVRERAGTREQPGTSGTPPPILGFAFYLVGTGLVALGLSRLALFAETLHVKGLAPASWWGSVIGQAMVLLGLVVAWRATRGTSAAHRRMLGAAAALWLTLLVVDFQRLRLQDYLLAHAPRAMMAPHAGPLVGRAIVLVVIALVVHASGRAFAPAPRTWATTLGAVLVVADAWAETWPIVTSMHLGVDSARLVYAAPSVLVGGVGLMVAGAGLWAAGRSLLRRTVDAANAEPLAPRSHPHSLLADGVVAVAGLALAHAVSVVLAPWVGLSARDVSDTATLGGELLAWTLVVVALRRMRPLTRASLGFAGAVLGALVLEAVLRYVLWSGGVFAPSSASRLAASVVPFVAGLRVLVTIRALRAAASVLGTPLRLGANLLGASLVASFFAPDLAGPGVPLFVRGCAVLFGGLSLAAMIAATRATQPIENPPAR